MKAIIGQPVRCIIKKHVLEERKEGKKENKEGEKEARRKGRKKRRKTTDNLYQLPKPLKKKEAPVVNF